MQLFLIQALIAGILFGIYPLLLNRAHLQGSIGGSIFSLLVGMFIALFILPFEFSQIKTLATANWLTIIVSAFLSAIAMIAMFKYLGACPKESVALMIMVMVVTQATVSAIYQIYMDGWKISLYKGIGLTGALVGIVFLNLK